MSSPGHERRVSFHDSQQRQPPPYSHAAYPPQSPGMRVPPSPRDYPYSPYEGQTPPRWPHSPEEAAAAYYPYDPREDPSRPYMPPMHGGGEEHPRMPPPEEYMRREGPTPRIHYRPSQEYMPPSPKRSKRYQGPPPPPEAGGPPGATTPGGLSLLAKAAMGGDSKKASQTEPEFASPVRRVPPSPRSPRTPTFISPPARYGHHRQPSRGGEWREAPPSSYQYRRDYYQPWTHEGPETPPAVVERGPSFDEGYYSPEQQHPGYHPYEYPPPQDYRYYGPDGRPYVSPAPSRDREEEAYQMSPYTYVQQPRLKEKTVLRKKFSWRNYPELESFLIDNRDDYLRHSAQNYTAEQKAYNNWLTERVLEVAGRYNYVFDPEEFNFVGIRDRVRCYYKSYVQTARKKAKKGTRGRAQALSSSTNTAGVEPV